MAALCAFRCPAGAAPLHRGRRLRRAGARALLILAVRFGADRVLPFGSGCVLGTGSSCSLRTGWGCVLRTASASISCSSALVGVEGFVISLLSLSTSRLP